MLLGKIPKKTWDLINSALNRPSVLPKVNDPTEIANTFSKFFSEAGVNIATL
jgi:hypothetical protein